MKGVWLLAVRHLAHHRLRSAILVACLAVPLFLPLATHLLLADFQRDIESRAATTPLLAGRAGNRVDLTLSALYFRSRELAPLPFGEVQSIHAEARALAIPLHLRFTARGAPVVGTTPEYYRHRGLRLQAGSQPALLGECVLGAALAERLGLGVGGTLRSDRTTVYDLVKPPALELSICGVLAAVGTADDDAVFVGVKTGWVLDGFAHGHDDVESLDEELIQRRTGSAVAVSPAMVEHQVVTAENIASFHFHGDPAELPITAILVVPDDVKAGTILSARWNNRADRQMLTPTAVIDELMAVVFRVKTIVDALTVLLAACTILLTGLVLFLSARLRAREMATLHRIGCGRGTVAALYWTEIGIILFFSALIAVTAVFAVRALAPSLMTAW